MKVGKEFIRVYQNKNSNSKNSNTRSSMPTHILKWKAKKIVALCTTNHRILFYIIVKLTTIKNSHCYVRSFSTYQQHIITNDNHKYCIWHILYLEQQLCGNLNGKERKIRGIRSLKKTTHIESLNCFDRAYKLLPHEIITVYTTTTNRR